uniref:Uncharacterized protein n=1 Tax=viral metagenome TaxID=1070528 RepID=A0A6C0CKF4_9ZZZZ
MRGLSIITGIAGFIGGNYVGFLQRNQDLGRYQTQSRDEVIHNNTYYTPIRVDPELGYLNAEGEPFWPSIGRIDQYGMGFQTIYPSKEEAEQNKLSDDYTVRRVFAQGFRAKDGKLQSSFMRLLDDGN